MSFLPLLALAAAAAAAPPPGPCAMSAADTAWRDQAMAAWNYSSREISGIPRVERIQAVIFDGACVLTSATAMNGGPQVWSAKPHTGQIELPDGNKIPAGVISFAGGDDKVSFFVMSTPSIWRAAVKSSAGLQSLDQLMIAVLLHEATHVAQMPTYGARMTRLAEIHKLPEDFNDDSIQKRFEGNVEFKESVGRETDLLLSAATAPDQASAARLAGEARAAMKARQQRWYSQPEAHLAEAEDIFLTMEGSAQWVAYQWLVDPKGGAVDPGAAFGSFGWRTKWWSQNQGFALFMALDRLAPGGWKKHAFGDGAKTILQMLDEAIAGTPN